MKKYRKIISYPKTEAKEALKDYRYVTVTEKIDGANASLKLSEDGKTIECFSRRQKLSKENDLRGFVKWVEENVDIRNLFPHVIYYGEWLVHHKVKYIDDAYNKFYLFDVYSQLEMSYQSCFNEVGIHFVESTRGALFAPLRFAGQIDVDDDLVFAKKFMDTSTLTPDKPEGVVIKDYTYRSKHGEEIAVKFINEEFREQQTKKKKSKPVKLTERETKLYNSIDEHINEISIDKFVSKMIDENIVIEKWKDEQLSTLLKNTAKLFTIDIIEEVFSNEDLTKDEIKFVNKKISMLFVTELKKLYFKG
jgi:hypothetical protein